MNDDLCACVCTNPYVLLLHRRIQRYELNVQYSVLLLMTGCGVPEVGHNLFSYNMKINCISAHTYNQILEMAPQTTKLPRL